MIDWSKIAIGLFASLLLGLTQLNAEEKKQIVSFNRDIRPILSSNCLHCHGPDSATREGELRLDDEKDVLKKRDDYFILKPGNPEKSELLRRVETTDNDEVMPPHETGKSLTPAEVNLLRAWIKQGGNYERHWSFIAPTRPQLPKDVDQKKVTNEIDRFVFSRLENEKLRASPPANKGTILRRVSLDLIGLPPTLKELDDFQNDNSSEAYERVVDRLLKSPHYGEQRTRFWLDSARFADTNGFFVDTERYMWRWRDWVINAYNSNMPFDQFTIEQLAGDLLPNATLNQKIASGFNRNHMTTNETGVIDEEYRVEYVVDRLDTTSTVWLGLTMGCARCHDHKFDPISQKEFFQLFAFFNNVPEKGTVGGNGNSNPILQVPSKEFQQQLARLKARANEANQRFEKIEPQLNIAQSKWERTAVENLSPLSTEGLLLHFPLDKSERNVGGLNGKVKRVGKIRYDAGILGQAIKLDGDSILEVDSKIDFERTSSFSFGGWIKPTPKGTICIVSKNDDANKMRGFDILIRKGKAVVHLIHKWNTNAIQVATKGSVASNRWQHLFVTYDGSSTADGVKIYIDGKVQSLEIRIDTLSKTIRTDQPLRIGRRSTSAPYYGLIDDLRIYDRELSADEASELFTSQLIQGVVTTSVEKRSSSLKEKLKKIFLQTKGGEKFRRIVNEKQRRNYDLYKHNKKIPTVMVMQENVKPRVTYFLNRGQYDEPGEIVSAAVPDWLPALRKNSKPDRLGFARWIVDPANPLTARVAVNRIWQQFFGTGLVKTTGDFGSQGEWPSHPELLDWLAVEYRENQWDTKKLIKLIVMSSTYRQSSRISKEALNCDPENRLLSHGPRYRLDAENVRDNALAISGLLNKTMGGPSVKPYQPKGLWKAVSYGGDLSYPQDHGTALYRRSLYTFWKRQSPPPALMAFDAPTRETCTVKRDRTNTPLQALVLMNDPTYVEAARVLAERIMKHKTNSTEERIQCAFRSATARYPTSEETGILLDIFNRQLNKYQTNKTDAEKLISIGESKRDLTLNVSQLAAWTNVSSMILNLDETITKN